MGGSWKAWGVIGRFCEEEPQTKEADNAGVCVFCFGSGWIASHHKSDGCFAKAKDIRFRLFFLQLQRFCREFGRNVVAVFRDKEASQAQKDPNHPEPDVDETPCSGICK